MQFYQSRYLLNLGISLLLAFFSSCTSKEHEPPYEPKEALSTFRLSEGFRIELVASEPLVTNPVEAAFDEDGRMYVVQMDDYPSEKMEDYAPGTDPKSKIMLLEDKNGDGFYESGTVFAEGLAYANGIMPWKGGVLVTSAPDILFLKDTDGDGKADQKEVILTGFALTNPQLRMSSMRYGLDNWIYAAYSRAGGGKWREEFRDKGGPLKFVEKPDAAPVNIFPGTNFRFRPDGDKIEPSGGMSQFGLSFDAFGNQFAVWNNVHLRHVVINDAYLANNPYLNVSTTMADISDHGNAASVYAITKGMLNLHESEMGHFTSACGTCEYTGGIFPGKFARASFVCEPVSNMVHADILVPDGATFKAQRAENEKEFLASTDSWFRPVNTTVGPDGGLYVVDFYRKLVEHPDWLAFADTSGFYTHAGQLKESDFLAGNDRGRIYRIVPKDFKTDSFQKPELSKADLKTLVGYLVHPNNWWRSTAQRLLVDRKDAQAVPLIVAMLSTNISPEAAVHCLWTLEGLGALSDTMLEVTFQNTHPEVRKQAILIAESRLENKNILQRVLQSSGDSDANVQFQSALTLGKVAKSNPEVFAALRKIISTHIADAWFQTAVLLGASDNALQWFEEFKSFETADSLELNGKREFLQKIASVTGARYKPAEMSSLVSAISASKDTSVVVPALKGLAEGMKRNTSELALMPEGQRGLVALISDPFNHVKDAAIDVAIRLKLMPSADLSLAINKSKQLAKDESLSVESRALAIRILGLDITGAPLDELKNLLETKNPVEVQFAAIRVLLGSSKVGATDILVSHWNLLNPKLHEVVETGFLLRKDRTLSLIMGLENNAIKPEWVSRNTRTRLIQNSDSTIREKAKKFFEGIGGADREKVIIDYNVAITVKGDPAKGKLVFRNACSACHSLEGVGINFGPDLHSVSHQTKINLLTMILNPNHDIAPGYEGYMVETTGGSTLAGIIESETDDNLVLKTASGAAQTVPKSSIKSLAPMQSSLMTEGLESSINKEEMGDLLEYIKTLQ